MTAFSRRSRTDAPGRAVPDDGPPHRLERRIHRLAERQHGVVTRGQLLEAGVSTGMVQRRLQDGRLRRLHQGVYQVGPVLAALAREMAAVLGCGPRAAVSHRSSATLRKLAGRPAGIVEVSVTQGHPPSSA